MGPVTDQPTQPGKYIVITIDNTLIIIRKQIYPQLPSHCEVKTWKELEMKWFSLKLHIG